MQEHSTSLGHALIRRNSKVHAPQHSHPERHTSHQCLACVAGLCCFLRVTPRHPNDMTCWCAAYDNASRCPTMAAARGLKESHPASSSGSRSCAAATYVGAPPMLSTEFSTAWRASALTVDGGRACARRPAAATTAKHVTARRKPHMMPLVAFCTAGVGQTQVCRWRQGVRERNTVGDAATSGPHPEILSLPTR